MKTVILAAISALVLAGQAQALSCVPADVARTFAWASEAEESYLILNGSFAFTPAPAWQGDINSPPSVQLPATFEGRYLTQDGFVDAPPLEVLLDFVCLGPWCGAMQPDAEVLAFVEQTQDGYVLQVEPCSSTVLDPSDRNLAQVTSCMRGTGCDVVQY